MRFVRVSFELTSIQREDSCRHTVHHKSRYLDATINLQSYTVVSNRTNTVASISLHH